MSEVSDGQIKGYELLISDALFKRWNRSEPETMESLTMRVSCALEVTRDADAVLSPREKMKIAQTIKSFIDLHRDKLDQRLGKGRVKEFRSKVREIIDSRGEEGPSFIELHRLSIQVLSDADELAGDPDSVRDVELDVAELKSIILSTLKGIVGYKMAFEKTKKRLDISDEFDALGDELRGEKPFEDIAGHMLDLIKEQLSLQGVAISYDAPIKEKVQFGDNNYPSGNISENRVLASDNISNKEVRIALDKVEAKLQKGADLALFDMSEEDQETTYCVIPIKIRESQVEIGNLVLVLEGQKEDVTEDFKELAKYVENLVDTLVDEGMKAMCTMRYMKNINRVAAESNVSQLPNAFRRYLTLLREVIGEDITFVYDDFRLEGFRVTESGIEELSREKVLGNLIDDEENKLETLVEDETDDGSYYISLFDRRRDLMEELERQQEGAEEVDDDETSPPCVGTIIVRGGKPLREEQKKLIRIAAHTLHSGVLERKSEYERLSTGGAGQFIATLALEGNLEFSGDRPVCVQFVDVASSTAFCERIGHAAYAELLDYWYAFQEEIEIADLFAQPRDKTMGDGAVYLNGSPHMIDGRDFIGGRDTHPGYYLAVGLHNMGRSRDAWNRAMHEYEKPIIGKDETVIREARQLPFHPKLNGATAYGDSATVGFIGKGPKTDNQRLNPLDYTVIGDPVHYAARLCDAAEEGETLLTRENYKLYRDFVEWAKRNGKWDERMDEYVQVGPSIVEFGKGVADPMDSVSVVKKSELERRQKEKAAKICSEGGSKHLFASAEDIPTGDYAVNYMTLDDQLKCYKFVCEGFDANIPVKEMRRPNEQWIPIDEDKRVRTGEIPRRVLRVVDGKPNLVEYRCIVLRHLEEIKELKEDSGRNGQGWNVHFENLPSGEYIVREYSVDEEGDNTVVLSFMGEEVITMISADRIEGFPIVSGILVHAQRKFECQPPRDPEWNYLKGVT